MAPAPLRWQNEKMLFRALQRIFPLRTLSAPDPSHAKAVFLFVQLAFAGLILALIYLATRRRGESGFRVREADQRSRRPTKPGETDPLANARMGSGTLRLSGIRIQGEPHEILGIRPEANASEIQSAYRELMKRYHPDIVGRPGTREWNDAQKIAEAINRARTEMLKALDRHSQSPNRSGR